jgi:cytoskeletal protein RodZ
MQTETHQERFGSYLRQVRLERGVGIRTLSGATKIAAHLILAMEESDHRRLPPKPYVKGFIRTYAKAVGADAEKAIHLYLAELERVEHTKRKALKRQASLGRLRRFLLAVGIVTSILLLVRLTDFFLVENSSPPENVSEHSALAKPDNGNNETAVRKTPRDQPKEKLRLRVTAVESTWLKVIVDGTNARSYELQPEDRLELEGTDSFNLMIGDANGLVVFLNDNPVMIYGSKGQTVSLKLP